MIVTNDDFIEFIQEYYRGEFSNQRVGQAFVNKFFEGEMTDPDLFYTELPSVAFSIIMNKYVRGK